MSPRIAITSGEPAGIGPDIILSALQDNFAAQLVVVGDPELFRQRAQQLGLEGQSLAGLQAIKALLGKPEGNEK